MSALTFTDQQSYRAWLADWRLDFNKMSREISRDRLRLKRLQRSLRGARAQANLLTKRKHASAHMELRHQAARRWQTILDIEQSLASQAKLYPLNFNHVSTLDLHFNKGSLDFPLIPKWVVKAKGQSYYISHADIRCPFSTKELDRGSTRGMLRFKNCSLMIDANGLASINQAA